MRKFFTLWVLGGLALFYFGPVEWGGAANPLVAVIVLACLGAFLLGSRQTTSHTDAHPAPFPFIPKTGQHALILMAAHAVLTLIAVNFATGRSALAGADYSLDFGGVYDDYAAASATAGAGLIQQMVLIGKAFLFPFALVTFIHRFRSDKWIVFLFVGPLVVSSLFRGTDKEIVDLLVLLGVASYLHGLLSWRRILVGSAAISGALAVFLLRRISRFGGDLPQCLPETNTCFNYDSQTANLFGDAAETLRVFVTFYTTNGYEGMSRALNLPWIPNWGLGHLPPVKTQICAAATAMCPPGDYQSSLTASGWNAQQFWTSIYTVIANDISFALVPVYFLMVGAAFQRSMAAWRTVQDPAAGATIVIIAVMFVYSSANMQVAVTLDWTFATVLLLYITPWRGLRGSREPVNPPSISA